MKKFFVFMFALCSVFQVIGQTDGGASSDSKMIELSRGIYMYQNNGGNIGLSIGTDGVFMIDDQVAEVTDEILKDIKRLTKAKPSFVVNTHHHKEHTGGNANMAKEGAIIVAHENVRKRISGLRTEESRNRVDKRSLPTITFTENIKFHFNGEEILVFHVPKAHTDGDAMVYFTRSNVLHTGGTFVEGGYPLIDAASGGSVAGYSEALETIVKMIDKNTKIIPGHGGQADVQDVIELNRLLGMALKRVTYHHLNGKSEAQILAMTEITEAYDEKGWGEGDVSREKFLKCIYDEVSKEYDLADMKAKQREFEEMKKKSDAAKKKSG